MGDKIAKVTLNGKVLMNISEDTVDKSNLLKSQTAHNAAGEPIVGEMEPGGGSEISYVDNEAGGTTAIITDEPSTWDNFYSIADDPDEIVDADYIPFNDVSDAEKPKKKTLFSGIKEKLKSMFSWFQSTNSDNTMVWNAKAGSFIAQIKVDKSTNKMAFNWSSDDGATWHGNVVLQNDITGQYYNLAKENNTVIAANTDLNTIVTPGTYTCTNYATTQTLTNCPVSQGFKMIVVLRDNNNDLVQEIVEENLINSMPWRRIRQYDLTWGSWQQYASASNIPNLQDKTHYLDCESDSSHTIRSTDDLNDFTNAGTYQYRYQSAGLPANCPFTDNWSFKLVVDRYGVDSRSEIMQRITMQNTNLGREMDWYRVRNWNTNTWQPWFQVAARQDLDPTVAVTGKNLIPTWFRPNNQVASNGITFTFNPADGSITANGTATADATCILWRHEDGYYLPQGRYILTGCPSGGSNDKYRLTLQIKPDGASEVSYSDYGSSSFINLSADARNSSTSNYYISIKSGQTVSDLVFRPMIRPDWTSATYEPNENIHKGNCYVGTCSTASVTKDKEAFVDGYFVLRIGARVAVKYTYTNSFNSQPSTPITLNVNRTGAKQIWYNAGATGSSSGAPTGYANYIFGQAGRYIYYVYDGNYWCWDGHGLDNNNTNFVRNDASSTVTANTPTITLKASDVDTLQSNNGVSATKYPAFFISDKNGKTISRMETVVETNGNLSTNIYCWNYDSSGNIQGAISFKMTARKDGTSEYAFSDASKLNRNTGFGYEVCNTAAATAAKEVSMANYKLVSQSYVTIRFANDVPANATLNINGQGAKSISYRNALITAGKIKAGDIVTFVYDGTYYRVVSNDRWGGKSNNLVTNTSTQIIWSKTIRDVCTELTTGLAQVRMINDIFLYVSVECTYNASSSVTIPAYNNLTDNVFWRFAFDGFPKYDGTQPYSEVMVDINGVVYPAWSRISNINESGIEIGKCLFVALRTNATLPSGRHNIRFTYTVMME